MYAIVEIAGQQFKVEQGKKIFVHRLEAEEGTEIQFDQVLLIEDEGKITIGEPVITERVAIGDGARNQRGSIGRVQPHRCAADRRLCAIIVVAVFIGIRPNLVADHHLVETKVHRQIRAVIGLVAMTNPAFQVGFARWLARRAQGNK